MGFDFTGGSSRSLRFSLCLAGVFGCLALLAAGGQIGRDAVRFGALYGASFVLLLGVVRFFPHELSIRRQWLLLLVLAVLARTMFLGFPVSTDVNRYVWEGMLFNRGENPYKLAPDDPALEPYRQDPHWKEIWRDVNHKDKSACYPPLSMLVFRAAAAVSPTLGFFKAVIVFFDLAVVGALALLLHSYALEPRRLLLYGLNPLVLVFIAGEGHLDSIQLFFMVFGFYLLKRKRSGAGFFSLGCAVMSKYFAVLFLPFWIHARNARAALWAAVPLVFYLPFSGTGADLFTSLTGFGTQMHYNDSITAALRTLLDTESATAAAAVLLAVCLAAVFLSVHDPLRSSYLAAGALLLFLPTLHPWYLTLVAVFLPFFPSRAWYYLCFGVAFTFWVLHVEYRTGVFQEIFWVKWLEYAPFYALLLWDFFRQRPPLPWRVFAPVCNLSVVIPALDEEQNIAGCIESVRGAVPASVRGGRVLLTAEGAEGAEKAQKGTENAVSEIIVADGGSEDGTRRAAEEHGASVVSAPRGRGLQIAEGVRAATADVVLVFHADCRLRAGTAERALAMLNRNPHYPGGALGMHFTKPTPGSWLISFLNNARSRLTSISFGDQGQFFRREALPLIGGFPELMLMEDVELSLRLKECGPLGFLPNGVEASTRRWRRAGFFGQVWKVLRLLTAYLLRRRIHAGPTNPRSFYDRYYRTNSSGR